MNLSKKFFGILCICTGVVITNARAQDNGTKLTLENCLSTALANNIPVKQSKLSEEEAKLNLNQSKYNRLPNVAAGLNYGINSGRSIDPFTNSYNNQTLSSSNANITASVPVFRGFKTNTAIQQASLAYQATQKELQQEKDNLTLNVILAFLQMMNDEDVLQQTKEQIIITQKQLERLETLNKEGAIAPAVLFDMKGQYAADQLAIVNAAKSYEISKLGLSKLMNVPYNKDMQIDRQGFDLTVMQYVGTAASIYQSALENLAMVKAADLRVKAAEKRKKLAAADLYPSISLVGQLGTNYSSAARILNPVSSMDVATNDYVVVNGNNLPVMTPRVNYNSRKIGFTNQYNNNLNTYFGVNISIPIFSAFQTKTNIKLAKIEEKRSGIIADNTKTALRQAIDEAWVSMTSAYEKYVALKDQVAAYQESFRSAEIRFNLGAINSVEYLIVKNNFDQAKINMTISRYEYLLRTKVLDFYQGKLN